MIVPNFFVVKDNHCNKKVQDRSGSDRSDKAHQIILYPDKLIDKSHPRR